MSDVNSFGRYGFSSSYRLWWLLSFFLVVFLGMRDAAALPDHSAPTGADSQEDVAGPEVLAISDETGVGRILSQSKLELVMTRWVCLFAQCFRYSYELDRYLLVHPELGTTVSSAEMDVPSANMNRAKELYFQALNHYRRSFVSTVSLSSSLPGGVKVVWQDLLDMKEPEWVRDATEFRPLDLRPLVDSMERYQRVVVGLREDLSGLARLAEFSSECDSQGADSLTVEEIRMKRRAVRNLLRGRGMTYFSIQFPDASEIYEYELAASRSCDTASTRLASQLDSHSLVLKDCIADLQLVIQWLGESLVLVGGRNLLNWLDTVYPGYLDLMSAPKAGENCSMVVTCGKDANRIFSLVAPASDPEKAYLGLTAKAFRMRS